MRDMAERLRSMERERDTWQATAQAHYTNWQRASFEIGRYSMAVRMALSARTLTEARRVLRSVREGGD